jgi:Mrp family chromosome partitioning ATPase/DUF971 family protein
VEDGLSRVTSVIAVSSCKGGVGKSSVSAHLALTLAEMGGRVGIFDADLFGPSLPELVQPSSTRVVLDKETNRMRPVLHHGVRLNSYGWTAPRNSSGERGGAAMRGPMASSVVQQLAQLTDWGELDYLVVDMPPGTGDVVITLGQKMTFAGAVIVTTPHPLARVDVRKGIELFDRMQVPPLALVNNMAYLPVPGAKEVMFPFGRADTELAQLCSDSEIARLINLPIDDSIREPPVFPYTSPTMPSLDPDQAPSQPVRDLAEHVVRNLLQREAGTLQRDRDRGMLFAIPSQDTPFVGSESIKVRAGGDGATLFVRVFDGDSAAQHRLSAHQARQASLAADAGSPDDVPSGVLVQAVTAQGNYAVEVVFSDGHTAILPLKALAELAARPD